jgi:hypothetical protein
MMTAEQKSAWLNERCGLLTASRMKDAMDYRRDGKPGSFRVKLLHELLAERLTGLNVPHVVTPPMERGLEFEDEMFDAFVELTGRDVRLSRFYKHPDIEYFGATPDRELDDGLMEGKIPGIGKFIEWKLAGGVPEEHKPQLLAQLACSGKKWTGFVAYCPEMPEPRHRLFLAKFEPKPEEIAAVEDAARTFLAELDAMFERFTEAA